MRRSTFMWRYGFQSSVDENTNFLVTRWDEFFGKAAPDTYRPKICNILALLREMLECDSRAKSNPAWAKSIPHVRDELKERLGNATTISLLSPFELHLLAEVTDEKAPTRAIQAARELSLELDETLYDRVIADVRRTLAGLPRKKVAFEESLGELATLAVQRGLTYDDFDEVFTPAELTAEAALDAIVGVLRRQKMTFQVAMMVSGRRDDAVAIARKAGFEILSIDQVGDRPELTDSSNTILVSQTIETFSPRDALKSLLKDLRASFDFYDLYRNSEDVTIHPGGWGRRPGGEWKFEAMGSTGASTHLHPRKGARRLTLSAIEAVQGGRNDEALKNALELHAESIGDSDPRLRLVNTWSAFECLASVVNSQSVIGRVTELAAPIIAWRRMEKVARYIAIGLHEWRKLGPNPTQPIVGAPNAQDAHIPAEDIVLSLCAPENDPRIVSLLDAAAGNPLLVHRIYRAWGDFHDPREVRKLIEHSETRAEWQIHRIYRARNLLVHHGNESPCLEYLSDNLLFYFSIVASRLIHGLTINPRWTLADSAFHWLSMHRFTKDCLRAGGTGVQIQHVVPHPMRSANQNLWEPARPAAGV